MRLLALLCLFILCLLTFSPTASGEVKTSPGSRRAVAFALDGGRVFVSWRYKDSDGATAHYEVKRSDFRTGPYTMGGIFREGDGTNFVDSTRTIGKTSYYFVTSSTGTSWIMDIKSSKSGDTDLLIPIRDGSPCSKLTVGDLNGDGLFELIICRTEDKKALGLEAYTLAGKMLWRSELASVGEDVSLAAWDIDSDGKEEVIVKHKEDGMDRLVALNPTNGKPNSNTVLPGQLPAAPQGNGIDCQPQDALSLFWNGNNERELAARGQIICRDNREILASYQGKPAGIADILGDWREELITIDGNNIRIYTTGIHTTIRRPSLMDDPQYRFCIARTAVGCRFHQTGSLDQ